MAQRSPPISRRNWMKIPGADVAADVGYVGRHGVGYLTAVHRRWDVIWRLRDVRRLRDVWMNRWKKSRHAANLLTITIWHTALKEGGPKFPGDVARYVGRHGVHLTAVHLLAPVAPAAQRCVGSTRSTVGSTRRRSTVGIKEGEERQKQKCAKCHGAVLTDCWAKLGQKLCVGRSV